MAKVNLEINGRKYALGCDDGEEDRLQRLGEKLDARVRTLADQFGQIGDVRLLVMAGITMTDEMEELRENMEGAAESATAELRRETEDALASAQKLEASAQKSEVSAADALADAARQIEQLAAKLQQD
ncbi:MAG: cell division protein ZapA [Robiginitomaculum sp.]|nr:cell division protein ZapA [Robiginitomaculum sp.]